MYCFFFFFNDTATTEIYTLSLHDALPILRRSGAVLMVGRRADHLRLLPLDSGAPRSGFGEGRHRGRSASRRLPHTDRNRGSLSQQGISGGGPHSLRIRRGRLERMARRISGRNHWVAVGRATGIYTLRPERGASAAPFFGPDRARPEVHLERS